MSTVNLKKTDRDNGFVQYKGERIALGAALVDNNKDKWDRVFHGTTDRTMNIFFLWVSFFYAAGIVLWVIYSENAFFSFATVGAAIGAAVPIIFLSLFMVSETKDAFPKNFLKTKEDFARENAINETNEMLFRATGNYLIDTYGIDINVREVWFIVQRGGNTDEDTIVVFKDGIHYRATTLVSGGKLLLMHPTEIKSSGVEFTR